MTFIVATNVIASRPPERRPTGTPHARANKLSQVGGWLDQVGIKLSQLSTKLKLKLSLAKSDQRQKDKLNKDNPISNTSPSP